MSEPKTVDDACDELSTLVSSLSTGEVEALYLVAKLPGGLKTIIVFPQTVTTMEAEEALQMLIDRVGAIFKSSAGVHPIPTGIN